MDKLLIASYVIATAAGLVLLKLGTNSTGFLSIIEGKMTWNINLLTVIGIATYGISFFLYILLISRFNLGFIVPLTTALVYILVFSASYFIFGESFSALKILAICLIIGGVVLLNLEAGQGQSNPQTHTAENGRLQNRI